MDEGQCKGRFHKEKDIRESLYRTENCRPESDHRKRTKPRTSVRGCLRIKRRKKVHIVKEIACLKKRPQESDLK